MATPAWQGPWFSANSPWNTPIPPTWASHVHPDNSSMVMGEYTGTDYSSADIHAFAYRPTEMTAKWGSIGTTYMKWCGPGGLENVVFAPTTQPLITVYQDWNPTTHTYSYRSSSFQIPLPSNWTGFNQKQLAPSYYERRTSIVCQNGDLWLLYQPTPPGDPILNLAAGTTDTFWHCSKIEKISGGWAGDDPVWSGGGSGLPHFAGLITPYDILNTPTGGHYNHVICANFPSSADGSFAGHPKFVWPATKSDGRTKTAVGIPFGGRIFLDPSMTDSDFIALGITKEWQLQIARTMQVYGMMGKESMTGQGAAGSLLCESQESIAWNIAQRFYPSGFQWPWVTDGTTTNVSISSSTYNAAFPTALMPTTGSRWKVINWNDSIPGITTPGTSGGGSGGGGGTGAGAFVKEIGHATPNPAASTYALAVSAAPASGNMVVLGVAWNNVTQTLTSVTDSKGNTWSVDKSVAGASTQASAAVASTLQNAGTLTTSDTITLHFSGTVGWLATVAHEFSGMTNTVDQTASNNNKTGTGRDAGTTATTTNANDLVYAVFGSITAETSFTAGSGYTAPSPGFYATSPAHASIDFEYDFVTATGTFNPTGTGASLTSVGVTVVYEQAVAGTAPANTVQPAITGTAIVGNALSVSNGIWTDDGTGAFTYQWQRDNTGGGVFSNISSATSNTYTLVAGDANCNIQCVVTDTDGVGSTGVNSTSVGPVTTTPFPPANTVAPVISGTPTVGSTLSCTTGTWTDDGSPTFTYQWQSADFSNTFTDISGATSSSYTLTSAEDGLPVQCLVTDTDSRGSTEVPSSNSPSVTFAAAANTVAPTISGTPSVGSTVSVSVGTWTPATAGAVSYTYQWQDSPNGTTGWANITGAVNAAYTIGALEQGKYLRCVVTGVTDGG